MTRDIQDRLRLFESNVQVQRIALNFDQIEQYDPPPNPAKATDSRFEDYQATHGDESWELDALEPKVIAGLVEDAVTDLIDQDVWDEAVERQKVARKQLTDVSRRWNDIVENL
jgi:hypothetical protein